MRQENECATKKVWIYDLRTNKHFTLKENTLKEGEIACFQIPEG
jgi:hypothetical protein